MAFTIILGSKIAEKQADSLTESEFAALMEVYETLRLVPENGEKPNGEAPDGSAMRMITHRGIDFRSQRGHLDAMIVDIWPKIIVVLNVDTWPFSTLPNPVPPMGAGRFKAARDDEHA
ncbi:hypothetical protein OHA25_20150 [Nonomuraea sp. NBC_00507]|uniref:hypothetical protein n=1 Tax=Nonomuraea sp. NBC_00507 TaxID=2976002 RepID=UPI002E16DD8C